MIVRELIALLKLDGSQFEASAKRAEGLIGGLKIGLLAIGAAAAATGAALFKLAADTAEYGDHVAHMAEDLGFTTDQIQKLSYSAKLADMSTEELGANLKIFTRNAGQEALGKGDVFSRLGINIRDASGHLKGQQELLDDVADRFSKIYDTSVRGAYAMQLFGRSGVRMGSLLKGGTEALREQGEEARKLGLILDDEAIKQASKFDDSMKTIYATITGLAHTIGAAVLPGLNQALDTFKGWYLSNADLIRQNVTAFVKGLGTALNVVWTVIQDLYFWVDRSAQAWGGWTRALKILGAELVVIIGLLNWPIVLISALVAAVILAFDDITAFFQGRQSVTGLIVDAFNSAFDKVTHAVKAFVDGFIAFFKPVIDVIDRVVAFTGRTLHNEETGQGRGGQQKTGENVRTGQTASAAAPRPAAVPPALAAATPYPSRAPSVAISTPVAPSRRELNPALAAYNAHKGDAPQFLPEKPRPNFNSQLLNATSGPQVSPQAQIRGGGRGGVQVTGARAITNHISVRVEGSNIHVPEGTSTEQRQAIDKQIKASISDHWSEEIQRAMGDHPSHAGN